MNNLNDILTVASMGALSFAVIGAAAMSTLMLSSARSGLHDQRHRMDQSLAASRSASPSSQAHPVVKTSTTPAANQVERQAA